MPLPNVLIVKKVKEALYSHFLENQQKEIQSIIETNAEMQGIVSEVGNADLSIIHKGLHYITPIAPAFLIENIAPLSLSLIDRMDQYLDAQQNYESEVILISGYLRRLLNKANNMYDIKALMPDALYDITTLDLPKVKNINETYLSEEQIISFTARNQQYINIILRRITTNMLLGR